MRRTRRIPCLEDTVGAFVIIGICKGYIAGKNCKQWRQVLIQSHLFWSSEDCLLRSYLVGFASKSLDKLGSASLTLSAPPFTPPPPSSSSQKALILSNCMSLTLHFCQEPHHNPRNYRSSNQKSSHQASGSQEPNQ